MSTGEPGGPWHRGEDAPAQQEPDESHGGAGGARAARRELWAGAAEVQPLKGPTRRHNGVIQTGGEERGEEGVTGGALPWGMLLQILIQSRAPLSFMLILLTNLELGVTPTLAALPKHPKAQGTVLGGYSRGIPPPPPPHAFSGSQERRGRGCCSTTVFQPCRVLSSDLQLTPAPSEPHRGSLALKHRSLIKGNGPGGCTSAKRREAASIARKATPGQHREQTRLCPKGVLPIKGLQRRGRGGCAAPGTSSQRWEHPKHRASLCEGLPAQSTGRGEEQSVGRGITAVQAEQAVGGPHALPGCHRGERGGGVEDVAGGDGEGGRGLGKVVNREEHWKGQETRG